MPFLDDGSDQSYINAHVAEYLGYDNSEIQILNIGAFNGLSQKLETRQI